MADLNPFSVIEIYPEEEVDLHLALGLDKDRCKDLIKHAEKTLEAFVKGKTKRYSYLMQELTQPCTNINEVAFVLGKVMHFMGMEDFKQSLGIAMVIEI